MTVRLGLGVFLTALILSSCTMARGSEEDGSCALRVIYDGHVYGGVSANVVPPEGQRLGTDVLPSCDDGGGPSGEEEIELSAIPEVSPEVALARHGEASTVFVREGVERTQWPRALRAKP
jgi:hypothetical protein